MSRLKNILLLQLQQHRAQEPDRVPYDLSPPPLASNKQQPANKFPKKWN